MHATALRAKAPASRDLALDPLVLAVTEQVLGPSCVCDATGTTQAL